MDDLISRQAAIDAAIEAADEWDGGYNDEREKLIESYISKLPSAQPTFDARDTQYNLPIGTDLISRQALLDKFEPWLKVKDYNDGELNMLKAILYEIRFMRSAQPEPSQVARDIARIVENEKDMRVIAQPNTYWKEQCQSYEQTINKLRESLSTQPEIIRCKDCKYWDTTWQNDYAPNYHYCPMIDGTHRNDFYCADAERRTDG